MRGLGKDLRTGLIAVVTMTIVLGLGYPLAITGLSQLFFHGAANGSLVKLDGKVVGSRLVGQEFKGKAFFHSRPSATEYSGDATFFANVGPNSVEGREEVRENLAAYIKLNRPYDKGLTRDGVPVDAVTNSASGVDPQISEANARIQAHRVAAVRGLPLGEVESMVDDAVEGRGLGVFGEPGVNVLELNIALEEAAPLKGGNR
jgi:potassium-transporting ATPase KdpC subunit